MRSTRKILCRLALALFCWSAASGSAEPQLVLVGSGSSITVRLYQAWIKEFSRIHSRVQIRYVPVGSSESIRQISQGVGDFGGGDVPLPDPQIRNKKISLTAIPMAVIGIVPIYNLPGHPQLNFTGDLLAQIYLGNIRNWHDARIGRLNPNVELPNLPVIVVHRGSGRGSSYIFTDFLAQSNAQFRSTVGVNVSPVWPIGLEAETSADMVRIVTSSPGAIAYVELSFAAESHLSCARVRNANGTFVAATPASIEAAALALERTAVSDLQADIVNAPGKDSYPIASFTWIYAPAAHPSSPRRTALKQFLDWSLRDGQNIAETLGYAPLPRPIAAKALAILNSRP